MTEEKRVKRPKSNGPKALGPQLSVKSRCPCVWAHGNTQGRSAGESEEKTPQLTNGAVGTHPVGITAAEAGVGEVSAVPAALVWALDPCQLTVQAAPARAAKTFSIHTDPVAGAGGIQAINWKRRTGK